MVGWDGRARGVLAVADTVKPSSARAIAELRTLGLRPMLLTGDNAGVAASVAREVGIDPADVFAEVLPADKAAAVRRLQAEGRVVAMVGDGVNDAAALATADLGLSMGTGADVAIEASDLTLVRGDLRAAATAIRLARRTLSTIKGNLFWAFAYNVAAIPLAAAGAAEPDAGGCGDGAQFGVRRDQQPAVAAVPRRGLSGPHVLQEGGEPLQVVDDLGPSAVVQFGTDPAQRLVEAAAGGQSRPVAQRRGHGHGHRDQRPATVPRVRRRPQHAFGP